MPGVPASVTSATDSPFASRADDALDPGPLVVLVNAQNRGIDLEMPQQDAGSAGVFSRDQLDLLEDLDGAERHVLEVADRRRDHVKNALRVASHPGILRYHCRMASPR